MSKLDDAIVYICAQHASFSFRAGTKRFKFSKHVLNIDTKEDMQTIDAIIDANPAFAFKIRKADKVAAEALVNAHRSSHGGAAKGMFNSEHAPTVVKPMRERDAAFANLPPDQVDALTDKMKEEANLLLTAKVAQSIKSK